MVISLSVLGATGRMGRRVISLAAEDPHFRLVGGHVRKDSPWLGQDLGVLTSQKPLNSFFSANLTDLFESASVVIDFSSPSLLAETLDKACQFHTPLVIGSTGHSTSDREQIAKASLQIPILFSPNFSLGIALALELVALLGKGLQGKAFIDIVETHHIHKKDAPSGTALALAKAVGYGEIAPSDPQEPRCKEKIAIRSIRSEEVIGEHTVIFECGHERIELKHEAHSRDAFAAGALLAAKFLVSRSPGLYSVRDLIKP